MVKQAPTLGRLIVMVGFALSCFGLLLFLWLAFGGGTPLKPKGYRFTTSFGEATQLAQEADVRISGVSVGKVKTIEPDRRSGRSNAVIELEPRYAPLPRDSRAILRQKTLLGETYVELTPGSKAAGSVPEGGRLAASAVSPTVELDEIFRAFDPETRQRFQQFIQRQALATRGRGQDINDAIGNLAPFAEDANVLLKVLNSQDDAVRRVVRNTGEVFEALSARDGQLRSLIENSNRVFATTARRDRELKETFVALPTFNRETKATVERLTEFAQDTDPLITQLRPAARELSPTLTDLAALSPDLRAFFRDLDTVISVSRTGLPATRRFLDDLRPALGEFNPVLRNLNPMLDYIGRHKRELTSFFSNTVAATQAVSVLPGEEPVHYLRTVNPINLENLAVYNNRLGSNRPNPYQLPNAFDRLEQGLPVFDDRHCGRGPAPVLGPIAAVAGLLGESAANQLQTVLTQAAPGAGTPAPPCKKQTSNALGTPTQFPQVTADPAPAATRRAPRGK